MALGNDDGYLRTAQGTQIVHLCPGIPSLIAAYVGAETPQHFLYFPLRPRPAFIGSWAQRIADFIDSHNFRMELISTQQLVLSNVSLSQQVFANFPKQLMLSLPMSMVCMLFRDISQEELLGLIVGCPGFGV